MLSSELEALVGQLTEMARPVVSWLVPGLDPGQVEALMGQLPPGEVLTWFGWCNGVALQQGQVQDDINVIPGYAPLSLKEAVESKETYGGDPVLGENWIPVLAGAGGDIYAAVWQPGQPARVAGVLVGESTEIQFASLGQMVKVFNECYRRDAFYVDSQRHLAMDPGLYDEVYAEMIR
ncbi:hypothetical protein [Streptomyces lushanensis]|uniref:hypothetical protein n=1 Tax=Streptomyces lushanensis TaxID=1434255 RepID=UPI00082E1B94|nr:hypothetical protein [Streptomyces lushanensis]